MCLNKNKVAFAYYATLIITLVLGILFYIGVGDNNYKFITGLAFICILCITLFYICASNIIKNYFVFSVYVYMIFTQFGLCFIYYLISPEIIRGYGGEMYYFLFSEYYPMVLGLALISVASMLLAAAIFRRVSINLVKNKIAFRHYIQKENKLIVFGGILFLLFSCLYFSYYLLNGAIYVGMDYTDLHSSSALTNALWEYVIVFYGFGACYIFCCAEGKLFKVGIILFLATATVLLLLGNRGEVLFPFLACMGIYMYKNKKINYRIIILGVIISIVLIPLIKVFRHLGDQSLWQAYIEASPLSGIAEMGVSMRMTNYIISELKHGTRELLMGFSYYNPLVNIFDYLIPGNIRLEAPTSFNFRNDFYLWKAMTPVAESYANFGVIGVIFHHMIMGALLGYKEGKNPQGLQLVFLGCLTYIFIYSTRNVFASVPIYILLDFASCFFITIVASFPSIRRKHIVREEIKRKWET